jgi:tocopherol O-methyltransferase
MLLPPLCTQPEYVKFATDAGLTVFGGPKDISGDVSKTWCVHLSPEFAIALPLEN